MPPPVSDWRLIQKQSFTCWKQLSDFLDLDESQRHAILKETGHFPLLLPKRLADRIQKGTLDDPILKQFLPVQQERLQVAGFTADPVGESLIACGSRLLQKYAGRALLYPTSACAMHCRYCFRREFDYQTGDPSFEAELQQIAADPSITEVILSGGDPLSISNQRLKELLHQIDAIDHVTRIRFHTRLPVGIPQRIDQEFLSILEQVEKQVWFLLHINHPREWDRDLRSALRQIQKLAIPVLTQTVLLAGVNDNVNTLETLMRQLIDCGVVPYYLHQLDKVAGAAHFDVPVEQGQALIAQLQQRLPGYAVPRYVVEQAGSPHKTLIESSTRND